MNKKEVAEIKKQFKFENANLAIYNFGVYYVKSLNVESSEFKSFAELSDLEAGYAPANCWDELEELCFFDIIKKTFGGSIGKSLVEYSFPNEVLLDKNSVYGKLSNVLNNFTKGEVLKYASFLASQIKYDGDYAILISKSSYSVPTKDANGEKMDMEFYDGDSYEFLTVSICPVANGKPVLMVDGNDDTVKHQPIQRLLNSPTNGFVFPTFNERATDLNSVLVFNKKVKEPNTSIIEDVLGCVYELNPEDEQIRFNTLITKVIDEDCVDYEITKNIHESISELIENTSVNTEITELDKEQIRNILSNSGVSNEKLENFDEVFDEVIGEYNLKAVNLVENSKMNIKTPDIVVNIKNDSLDKVTSQVIDGHKCLVIELDENVEINGLNVKLD